MSDLAATNCGCEDRGGCGCGCANNSGCGCDNGCGCMFSRLSLLGLPLLNKEAYLLFPEPELSGQWKQSLFRLLLLLNIG